MPARKLVDNILRRWIHKSVAYRLSTLQTWYPLLSLPQGFEVRALYSKVAPLTSSQQPPGRRLDFDRQDDRELPLAQPESSITHSLHQRLRCPRRRNGYEGNNFTPKVHQNRFIPEGNDENAAQLTASKRKPRWKTKRTEELEEQLRRIAHDFPSVRSVYNLLKELTVHRAVKPAVAHYEALVLSNCDAELGSVKTVKAVLQEMEREHIAIGTSIYEAVLKVLAVHPDSQLRSSILDSMAKQWMSLTPSMEHFVIAGYIREGQLELALQNIERMHQQKTPVQQWLYGLLIYSLCEAEDCHAVLRLLYYVEDERVDIPTYTLHHVLDRASECLDLDLTKRIWRDMVEPTYINPSTGICYNVLLTAARAGDKALADSVSAVLSHRQSKPSELEYDLLEETCVTARDQRGAEKIRHRREQTNSSMRSSVPRKPSP